MTPKRRRVVSPERVNPHFKSKDARHAEKNVKPALKTFIFSLFSWKIVLVPSFPFMRTMPQTGQMDLHFYALGPFKVEDLNMAVSIDTRNLYTRLSSQIGPSEWVRELIDRAPPWCDKSPLGEDGDY